MWFKNATLLSLPREYRIDPLDLETALAGAQLRSPGDLEFETRGFVPVIDRPTLAEFDLIGDPYPPQMSRTVAGCTLIAFATETRLLPASILQDAVAKLCQKHEAEHGRRPGKRLRKQFREQALGELLPRALIQRKRFNAYWDSRLSLLVVDTTSDGVAEKVAAALRDALGSFPCRPLSVLASIPLLMSDWLISRHTPRGFVLGEECLFKDPSDTTRTITCRNQDLTADDIAEHGRAGNQVVQLGLEYEHRIGLVLDSRCRLRKLEFFDVVADKLADQEFDYPAARVDAEFTLMALELRGLFTRLDEILRFESTAPTGEQRGAIGDLLDSVNRSGMTVTISAGDTEITLGNGERKVVQKAARELDDLLRQDGASATLTDSAGNVLGEFGDVADSCPATAVEG
jgi:recombination associated protein RdgC